MSTTLTTQQGSGNFDFASACAAVAKSRLGGIQTPEQALTLASIALADDVEASDSPISFLRALGKASRDFHIVNGKPSLKADAMLARFQHAGGTVQWGEYSDDRCEGTFSHKSGGSITLDWTIERAKKAGLIKQGSPWIAHPRAMLRSRVITEAIRTIFPGVISGLYTDDEIRESTSAPAAIAAPAEPLDRSKANELYAKIAIIDPAAAKSMKAHSGGDVATFVEQAEAWLAEHEANQTETETPAEEEATDV